MHWNLDVWELLENGADAKVQDASDATLLHLAFNLKYWGEGNPGVVRLLLQYSSDIHAQDDKGQTHS